MNRSYHRWTTRGALFRFLYRLNRLRLRITQPLTVGVRLILLRENPATGIDCVLLVRHTYHDGWLLPGGAVERGETLEEAARREAQEEVGASLGPLRLQGVYTNFFEYKSDHVAVFLCRSFELPDDGRIPGGAAREIEEMGFFPLNGLPADLFSGHRRRLEALSEVNAPGFGKW